MTKAITISLLGLNAVLIILVVLVWSVLQGNVQQNTAVLTQATARKEDLSSQQHELLLLAQDLNSTLQQQVQKNEQLKTELAQITQDQQALQDAIQVAQQLPTPAPAPKPAPKPVRMVTHRSRTRAS